jgi:hypothetical protein
MHDVYDVTTVIALQLNNSTRRLRRTHPICVEVPSAISIGCNVRLNSLMENFRAGFSHKKVASVICLLDQLSDLEKGTLIKKLREWYKRSMRQ